MRLLGSMAPAHIACTEHSFRIRDLSELGARAARRPSLIRAPYRLSRIIHGGRRGWVYVPSQPDSLCDGMQINPASVAMTDTRQVVRHTNENNE